MAQKFVIYENLSNFSEKQSFRNLKNVPNFITHPSSTIVCGKTGSGKTKLVMNLIKIGIENHIWDQIIIISPDNDSEYDIFIDKLTIRNEMQDIPTINLSTLPKTLESFFEQISENYNDAGHNILFNKEKQTFI